MTAENDRPMGLPDDLSLATPETEREIRETVGEILNSLAGIDVTIIVGIATMMLIHVAFFAEHDEMPTPSARLESLIHMIRVNYPKEFEILAQEKAMKEAKPPEDGRLS